MKKYLLDLKVVENSLLAPNFSLLKLQGEASLPSMLPGQFAEIRVDDAPNTFLRRPISINYVDRKDNTVWFLIQLVGEGTKRLAALHKGDIVNVLLPLGNGFAMPDRPDEKLLLVGGGAGTAPMLYFGEQLVQKGCRPAFLLGARTASMLLQLDEYSKYGDVYTTTEDGSYGEKGFVTQHSVLQQQSFDRICCCGPKPMMLSVARYAKAQNIRCEVSLENKMACGLGACLCCVENTTAGHVCVCTEGPVFNINDLLWQI
ncbi:MAG: dihydroorotate dehydrogenase electron transfer subunit [Bacteroidaceae bacterium]|nr:dihydroorotate dehydrogenase electron transfer subunit [Bacteroidaceae bacterium]